MLPLDAFAAQVLRQPGRAALHFAGHWWTYAELDGEIERLGAGLRSASTPGELVAIWFNNVPQLLLLYLACWRGRRVPMPIPAGAKWPEVQTLLEHAGRPLLVSSDALYGPHQRAAQGAGLDRVLLSDAPESALDPAAPITPRPAPDDVALVLHTSGSEGRPKAVMLSAASVGAVVEHRIARMALSERSVLVVGSCLSQSVGLYQSLALLAAGGRLVLLESYAADALMDAVEQHQPTHLVMVVEAFDRLLHHPRMHAKALGSLQFAAAGADRVTERLQRRAMELTGRPLCVSYGLSESSWALFNAGAGANAGLALGLPSGGAQIRLCDSAGREVAQGEVGEIHIRSPRTMSGYLGDAERTRAVLHDGWLKSGDLAWQDPQGRYWFAGRSKHLIVLPSGDVVAPAEIESAARDCPGIARCVVLVGEGRDGSQHPVLYAVRSAPDLDAATLRHFLGERLADFKVPQRIEFLAELPTGLSGKLQAPRPTPAGAPRDAARA